MKSKIIDEYISKFPLETQKKLKQIRAAVKEIAPEATELISYGIPTFDLNGHLVHFAGFKNHIGFYPAPSGVQKFNSALLNYKKAKGSIRFALDKPLPISLIKKIIKFRVSENLQRFNKAR